MTGNPIVLPRHRRRLRPQRGLPQPGAAELAAGRHLRPRVRLRARRQHVLRDLDRHGPHHRGRPHQPEAADDRRGHGLQLARPDDLRRRQPRLRRRQPGPVHPRHERDPGAQAGRAVQGGLQARLAASARSRRSRSRSRSAAGPTWPRSTSSPARRTTTAPPPTGRRSAPRGSSTSPTSATRRSSPTSASRCTSARTARRSPATPARRASCRATRATTATSRAAHDPEILACSMIASGLRVFDIRDPANPREMAYYVAPNKTSQTAGAPSNYAMSSPSFVPERSEVWYTDGNSGFYNVKLAGWPFAAGGAAGAASGDCTGDAGFRSVSATPRGRRVRLGFTRRRSGRREDRGLPGLPGPADRQRAPRRALHEAGDLERPRPRRLLLRPLHDGRPRRAPDRAAQAATAASRKVARHYRRGDCELLRSFKLERPVFGGRQRTPLRVAYRLTRAARVTITVARGKRVGRPRARRTRAADRTYRLALQAVRARRLPGADHGRRACARRSPRGSL